MLGFKKLTIENWTEADETNRVFGRINPITGPTSMGQDDWAREFLAVELSENVPPEIQDLYAIARGAMLYGWFFYPLFRLGEEQLYRVIEAAVKTCYREIDGAKPRPSLHGAIEQLVECGLIPAGERERWTAARHLRNIASHPEKAAVVPPGMVLRMLKVSARDINSLFATHRQKKD